MTTFRTERVAEQMKHVIAHVIAHELKDPRAGFITVVGVKLSADLKQARVRFSVLGSDAQKRTAQRALDHARGYIQTRVARETRLKYTPVITFHLDESAEREIALFQKIDDTVRADRRMAVARAIRARVGAGSIPQDVLAEAAAYAASDRFTALVAELLTGLMAVDTTLRADVVQTAQAERLCLERIETALRELWGDELRTELLPIDPDLDVREEFTPTGYAPGLSLEEVYRDRGNLVAVLEHADLPPAPPEPDREAEAEADPRVEPPALRLAFNTHIDTIPPHLPPSRDGDVVRGRGACDAKGQAAMVVGAFALLRRLRDACGVRLRNDVCAQFVIDEETGGNGSLSLALQDPFRFDGIVVCECSDLRIHTANRGCVWYRAELTGPPDRLAELAAGFVLALEDEGRAIKSESDHPLFPARPVQTNHGILGPFGSAPSAVNDLVQLDVVSEDLSEAEIAGAARRGVTHYHACYGDKGGEHVTSEPRGPGCVVLSVHGKGGHMGSLDLCDNAITKAAHVIGSLAELRAAGRDVRLRVTGHEAEALIVEGGQGFVPTHSLTAITGRLTSAAERAAAEFVSRNGLEAGAVRAAITFDRLHNEAFAREPDGALAVYAVESARRAGLEASEPLFGWETSCDARLFAGLFPDREVVVFGPGKLEQAHGPAESICLRDIAAGAKMLALLALESAGFVT